MPANQRDPYHEAFQKAGKAWRQLGAGQIEEAILCFREAVETPGLPFIMALGVAYLWAREYEAAYKHFVAAGETESRKSRSNSTLYGMAGVAKWCLNDRQEAVNQWRAGLNSQYADGAGGVGLPLLLYCASVLSPSLISEAEVRSLLTIRADDPRVKNWPGPLAQFILERIDEAELRAKYAMQNELNRAQCCWSADFYTAVVERARGEGVDFKDTMRRLCATSPDDFSDTKPDDSDYSPLDFLLGKLWQEEFFIARREAE